MSAKEKIQHKTEAGDYSEGRVGLRKELGFYSKCDWNPFLDSLQENCKVFCQKFGQSHFVEA